MLTGLLLHVSCPAKRLGQQTLRALLRHACNHDSLTKEVQRAEPRGVPALGVSRAKSQLIQGPNFARSSRASLNAESGPNNCLPTANSRKKVPMTNQWL